MSDDYYLDTLAPGELPEDPEARGTETDLDRSPVDESGFDVATIAPQPTAPHAAPRAGAPRPDRTARAVHPTLPVSDRPPARAPSGALPGVGDTVRDYELIREIGRGGMGVVFLARDTRLARRVAIKFILAQRAELAQRFLIEARATARCHHENIVIIHDIGEHRGNPFMVLEYLQGRTLRQMMGGGPMTVERAVELMIPVVRALERAHDHGIVHRDLKPENIFVTDSGAVKVLDFGIAKVAASPENQSSAVIVLPEARKNPAPPVDHGPGSLGHTRPGAMLGTMPYMSPEQLAGDAIDHRTDLWTVGIMLFEMLEGKHPMAPIGPQKLQIISELGTPMPSAVDRITEVGKLGGVIDRCLIKRYDDRIESAAALLGELEALGSRRAILELGRNDSPFSGLAAFQESEADRFFGRDDDIAHLVTLLHSQPLVTVVGPSGSGKSSLVRAGVIPALKRSGKGWHGLVVRPGRDPLAALAALLDQLRSQSSSTAGTGASGVHTSGVTVSQTGEGAAGDIGPAESAGFSTDPERLRQTPGLLGRELRAWAQRKKRRVVILVDQFEELYTLVADREARAAFVRCLEGAADDASSPLRVVLAMRSDFLERVVEDSRFMAEVTRGLVFLAPMDRDGLREALTRPAEAAGYSFEDQDLVGAMLDALQATAGALPLLQFTASKLWDARDRQKRQLTWSSYRAFGGVAGALAAHADAVLASMPAGQVRVARAVFERLVTPERTRAITSMDELRDLPGDGDAIEGVVQHLADARLIAIESTDDRRAGRAGGPEDAGKAVELIHESLIASWPTLRHWLDENHEDAEFLARLRTVAEQWERSRQDVAMLWRGTAMRDAQRWHERYQGELAGREKRYLAAVFALADRRARGRRRAVSGLIAVLTVLVIAAAVALIWIRRAEREARQNADKVQQQLAQIEAEQDEKRQAHEALNRALETAQQARDKADRERQRAEQAQRRAEQERQRAEKERQRAEAQRAEAEALRLSAESDRARALEAEKQARLDFARAEQAAERAQRAEAFAEKQRERAEQASRRLQSTLKQQSEQLEMYKREYGIPDAVDLRDYEGKKP